jgi:hypothetical protein
MKYIILTALIVLLTNTAEAQVKVSKPAGLDGVIASRTANRKNPDATVKGYHILIYNGDSRSRAESMKNKFNAEFSDFSEVVWDEPNFKVYVGLFTSKFECMKLYEAIKGKFQTAIVVSAKIAYQPLD